MGNPVAYFQAALCIASGIPGWAERATVWFNLGMIYWAAHEPQQAVRSFVEARLAAALMNDPSHEGRALAMQGDALIMAGRASEALKPLLQALRPLELADDHDYLARALRLLSNACRFLGQLEKASLADAELERLASKGNWSWSGASDRFTALFHPPKQDFIRRAS